MQCIRSVFRCDEFAEITIEANPGTLKYTNLLSYLTYGINRLSIGLQTTDDEALLQYSDEYIIMTSSRWI